MWKNGTFTLEGDGIVLLSEGLADRRFFTKLVEHRKMPKMDFPWPVENCEEASEDSKNFYGKSNFANMLKALAVFIKGYPDQRGKIKCVVIATDAGTNRIASFEAVKAQIAIAKVFPVPGHELEFKDEAKGFPAIVVILVPISELGGLETLCVKAFIEANETGRQLAECQRRYFECSPAKPNEWGVEARDKGAFQCLIAASCKANPSMPTTWAFSKKGKKPPVIDIGAAAFNEIADAMMTIVAKVSSL